jgi:hypothetical protein
LVSIQGVLEAGVASHERTRELEMLADPHMQVWLQSAANRMVGELFATAQVDGGPDTDGLDSDYEFSDQLIRHELALIADDEYPLRVALRIAALRTARDALRSCAAIRALPEWDPRSIRGRIEQRDASAAGHG